MESLKELYKIGTGPSSSHTMGPKKAAEAFVKRASDADRYKVTLYGSLAATGKGPTWRSSPCWSPWLQPKSSGVPTSPCRSTPTACVSKPSKRENPWTNG